MARKILVIDDSLTLRQFIQRSLSQKSDDYLITTAKDGAEGLALAMSGLPDLILLDFILPDMRGDEVCRRLSTDPATASIPIVLMSSSLEEIKRTETEFEAVLKSIAKPFSPELLCAAVGFAFREVELRKQSTQGAPKKPPTVKLPSVGGKVFSGHTGLIPLLDPLLGLEIEAMTGLLKLRSQEKKIEFYVLEGRPLLATTRVGEDYLKDTTFNFTPHQQAVMEVVLRGQSDCGCPVFLSMVERGVLSQPEADFLLHTHGTKLFSQVWTSPRVRFEFESQSVAPDFASRLEPFPRGMSEWLMETCRHVGADCQSAMAWGDFSGIPSYTRRGYERIQQIPLIDEEMDFAVKVNANSTLAEIAQKMNVPVETAQAILYRFLCLQIYEYWPASILRPS